MSDLYKESIADAKALKELAVQNGKQMLAESFNDKLEDMVNQMLNEGSSEDKKDDKKDEKKKEKDMDEGSYKDDGKNGVPANNTPQPGEDPTGATDDDDDKKKNESQDHDLESFLESVDQELQEMRNKDIKDKKDDEEDKKDEQVDSSDIGKGDNKKPSPKSDRSQTEDPQGTKFFESMSREDLMSIVMEALEEASNDDMGDDDDDDDDDENMDEKYKKDKKDKKMKEMADTISDLKSELSENEDKLSGLQEQLKEAESVIDRLSSTITEANLLNSKLLHVNKLNNEFELSESQKEKILNKINEGSNLKEVKLIYSVLKESFDSNISKKQVNENSDGSASKVVGSTAPSKENIVENTESGKIKNRFQVLAGIKKGSLLDD